MTFDFENLTTDTVREKIKMTTDTRILNWQGLGVGVGVPTFKPLDLFTCMCVYVFGLNIPLIRHKSLPPPAKASRLDAAGRRSWSTVGFYSVGVLWLSPARGRHEHGHEWEEKQGREEQQQKTET